MAPEQMMGQPLTESTDLWALAVVLWEVAAEQKPWSWFSDFATLKSAVVHGHRLPLPGPASGYPKGYVEVMYAGMQWSPMARGTAHSMLQRLHDD